MQIMVSNPSIVSKWYLCGIIRIKQLDVAFLISFQSKIHFYGIINFGIAHFDRVNRKIFSGRLAKQIVNCLVLFSHFIKYLLAKYTVKDTAKSKW